MVPGVFPFRYLCVKLGGEGMNTVVFYVGRILFGGYFIHNGIRHFRHLKQMAAYTGSKGVPMSKTAVAVTGVLLLIGGLTVLLQEWVDVGLYALIAFFVPVTFTMHAFWKIQGPAAKMVEIINFGKNLALLGAVLLLLAR